MGDKTSFHRLSHIFIGIKYPIQYLYSSVSASNNILLKEGIDLAQLHEEEED